MTIKRDFERLIQLCIAYELKRWVENFSADDLLSNLATYYGTKYESQAKATYNIVLEIKRQIDRDNENQNL